MKVEAGQEMGKETHPRGLEIGQQRWWGPNLAVSSFFFESLWKVFQNVFSTEGGRAVGGTGAGCSLW